MKHLSRVIVLLFMFAHMAAMPAFAGIADSPLPELETGKRTYHRSDVVFDLERFARGPCSGHGPECRADDGNDGRMPVRSAPLARSPACFHRCAPCGRTAQ